MKSKHNFGFTIIEATVAIFILTAGILGAFSFISHFTEYSSISTMRLTASYLAQEGVEIVKNIRDTNWLESESESWNKGFSTSPFRGQADYTDDTLSDYDNNGYLNIDSNNFYSYGSGSQSLFQREIYIATSTSDNAYIVVTVYWSEKGRDHEVEVQEEITSWAW